MFIACISPAWAMNMSDASETAIDPMTRLFHY